MVTFAVMLVVSLLISTLAARVRAQAEAARLREERTRVLYAVSRDLAGARTVEEVAQATSRNVEAVFQGPATVLLPGRDGHLATSDGGPADAREMAVAQWAFDHRQLAGLGTDTLPGASSVYVPLQGSRSTLGVLGVRPADSLLPLGPGQVDLLDTLARQAASGLERVRLASEAEEARLAAETERLRSTLLSSVSHDLRTPLATITGAASSLLQPGTLGPEAERELKEAIYEEGDRLNRLVTNLLDMTRLESGSLQLNKDWQSLEELVGTALGRLEKELRGGRWRSGSPRTSRSCSWTASWSSRSSSTCSTTRPSTRIPPRRSASRPPGRRERSRSRWRTRVLAFRRERRSRSSRSSIARAADRGAPGWACPSAGPS